MSPMSAHISPKDVKGCAQTKPGECPGRARMVNLYKEVALVARSGLALGSGGPALGSGWVSKGGLYPESPDTVGRTRPGGA